MNVLRSLATRWPRRASFIKSHSRSMSSGSSRVIIKEDYEIVSPFPDVPPAKEDACSMVLEAARRWSHHTVTECSITGLSYTYGELLDGALRWASTLHKMGIGKGDVVAMFMPNTPHYPLVFLGNMACGAIVTCLNAAYTPNEVKYHLEDSGAKLLVVDPMMEDTAEKAISGMKNPPTVFVTGDSDYSRANLLDIIVDKNIPFYDFKKLDPEAPFVLIYSSGTTGLPKGVLYSNDKLSSHIPTKVHPDIFPYQPATKEHQDVAMGLMPFFHAYGIYTVMLCSVLLGVKMVTLPMFIPETFMEIMKKHKVEVVHLVPPILKFLVAHPMVKPDDLKYMRTAMCTAAPCPADAALALKEKAPNDILFQELYGMSETMPTNFTPLKGKECIGSCGPLLPNARAKVLDLYTRKPVGPGEKGELCIKSPSLMNCYYGKPEETAEMYTDDGWLKTGDVATYDEDGYFYIVDRIKELIKVKGLQVSPSELENSLLQHPGVADVGIVAVEDDRSGEIPRAYVVKKNPDLTEEEVVDYLKDKLAPHKQLAGGVRFVSELPKNPTGKLLRKVLKQWTTEE